MLRELLTHWWTQVYSVPTNLRQSSVCLSIHHHLDHWDKCVDHQHVVAPCLTPRWCCKHELFPAHGGGKVASLQPACNVSTRIGQSRVPPAGPRREGGSGLFGTFENIPQASQTIHQGLHSGTVGWKRKMVTHPEWWGYNGYVCYYCINAVKFYYYMCGCKQESCSCSNLIVMPVLPWSERQISILKDGIL